MGNEQPNSNTLEADEAQRIVVASSEVVTSSPHFLCAIFTHAEGAQAKSERTRPATRVTALSAGALLYPDSQHSYSRNGTYLKSRSNQRRICDSCLTSLATNRLMLHSHDNPDMATKGALGADDQVLVRTGCKTLSGINIEHLCGIRNMPARVQSLG